MKRSLGISKMKILDAYKLNALGFDPRCIIGFFCSDKLPLEVVKKYPHLHIISGTNQIYSNFHVPNRDFYYISAGDPDPDLEVLNEKFTEKTLQYMIEKFKGDNDEITDPMDLEVIRIFRMFVTHGTEEALDRIGDEIGERREMLQRA